MATWVINNAEFSRSKHLSLIQSNNIQHGNFLLYESDPCI